MAIKRFGLFSAILSAAIADFRDDALNVHNELRARHGSPPLSLNSKLNTYAQNYAQKLADEDKFEHSGGEYGENIYSITGNRVSSKNDSEIVTDAVRTKWYGEISKYNYNNPGFSFQTGHFTAIVWKNTKFIGIGVSRRGDTVYVVASYDPSGNFGGEFRENVLPLNSSSTSTVPDSNCAPSNYLRWISKDETIPTGFSPLFGGLDIDGRNQRVCTASYSGDLIPGKLVRGSCHVGYGAGEHKFENAYRYAVFRKIDGCSTLNWVSAPSTFDEGVPGGITADGQLLFISRCPLPEFGKDFIVPGKIHANDTRKAYYSFGGHEHTCLNYDVLVLN